MNSTKIPTNATVVSSNLTLRKLPDFASATPESASLVPQATSLLYRGLPSRKVTDHTARSDPQALMRVRTLIDGGVIGVFDGGEWN